MTSFLGSREYRIGGDHYAVYHAVNRIARARFRAALQNWAAGFERFYRSAC